MQSKNTRATGRKRRTYNTNDDNRGDKAPKLTLDDLADVSLSARGLKDNFHGDFFQLNLLMLIFWRAKLINDVDFGLATEHPETDKFDDVVFIYSEKSNQMRKCRCLQAKHKDADSKNLNLTEKQLLSKSDEDFALQKYLKSFVQIKQKCNTPGSSLFGCEIEDVTLLTNKRSTLKAENFESSLLDNDRLLSPGKKNSSSARRYQIRKDSEFYKKLEDACTSVCSAQEMVEFPEFIKLLGIVGDYPDRNQVNACLMQEMEDHYNVMEGEAKVALYRDEMLKWFADRKCTFLMPAKANELFASLEGRLHSYEVLGSTKSYFAKTTTSYEFTKYDDVRVKLQNFLKSPKYRGLILNFDNIQLGRARVVQGFKNIIMDSSAKNDVELSAFTQHFGHIFISLEQLLHGPFAKSIISELNNIKKGNLLVIDSQPDLQDTLGNFVREAHAAVCSNWKIIIFSEDKIDFDVLCPTPEFKTQYLQEEYETKLENLTMDSQNRLRSHGRILLQGQEKLVEEVFETEDGDMICSDVLAELMFGKAVEIGANKTVSAPDQCYIERTFCPGIRNENPDTQHGRYMLLLNKTFEQLGRHEYCLNESRLVAENNKINIISDLPGMGKSALLFSLAEKVRRRGLGAVYWTITLDLNICSPDFQTENLKRSKKGKWRNSVAGLEKGNTVSAVNFLLDLLKNQGPHSQCPNKISRHFFKKVVESKMHRTKIALFFDAFDEISPDYVEIVLDLLQTLCQTNISNIFLASRPFMEDALENGFANSGRKIFHLDRLSRNEEIMLLKSEWMLKIKPAEEEMEQLEKYVSFVIEKNGDLIAGIPLHIRLIADLFLEDCSQFLEAEDDNPALVKSLDLWELFEALVEEKFRIYCKEKAHIDSAYGAAKSELVKAKERFCERYQIIAAFSVLTANDFKDLCSALSKSDNVMEQINAIVIGEDKTGFVDALWNGVPHFVHPTFAEYFLCTLFVDNLVDGKQMSTVYQILLKIMLHGGHGAGFLDVWLEVNSDEIEQSILDEIRKEALQMLKKDNMAPLWSLRNPNFLSFIVDASCIVESVVNYPLAITSHTLQVIRHLEGLLSDIHKQVLFSFLWREVKRVLNESKLSGGMSSELVIFSVNFVNDFGNYVSLEGWTEYEFWMDAASKMCSFTQFSLLLKRVSLSQRYLQNTIEAAASRGNLDDFNCLVTLVDNKIMLKDPLLFQSAVQGGNVAICEIILDANHDNMQDLLLWQNEEGRRALYKASRHPGVCRLLLQKYIEICEGNKEIPIQLTENDLDIMTGTLIDIVKSFSPLDPSDAPNICNCMTFQDSIFHLLIYSGECDAVEKFFDEGFEFCGYSYETIVFLLEKSNNDNDKYTRTIGMLLQHIKIRNLFGFNDLFLTTLCYGDMRVLELLIQAGADVTTGVNFQMINQNYLHVLAEKSDPNVEICKFILHCVPEAQRIELLSFRNYNQSTPLHIAAIHHHVDLLTVMLGSVSNVEARTKLISGQEFNNRTVLHSIYDFFSFGCCPLGTIIDFLDIKSRPCVINIKDANGRSVLYEAVRNGDVKAIRVLLNNGADLITADTGGKTLLHRAVKRKDYDFILFIVTCFDPADLQSHINEVDGDGKTALDYAEQDGNHRIVELLVGKDGAKGNNG